MATITAGITSSTSFPASGLDKAFRIVNTVDMKTLGAANADVVQALQIPAGTFVSKVLVKIVRAAAGTTATATVGDGTDADGFDTSVDLKGTAGTYTFNGLGLTEGTPNTLVDAFAAGKVYTAADTIDLTVSHNTVTDAGSVQVIAICHSLN